MAKQTVGTFPNFQAAADHLGGTVDGLLLQIEDGWYDLEGLGTGQLVISVGSRR
ncbi:MAG: hypothetical protein GY882_04360 [Actinomycetia bacterium]|nr:hypothetical protein [Actinomycetes bacterium]